MARPRKYHSDAERRAAHRERSRNSMRRMRTRRRADRNAKRLSKTKPTKMPANPVRALVAWADARLIVPSGLRQGKRWEYLDWQKSFLADTFREDVILAVCSTGRKCGKTGLLASLLLSFLDERGPFHNPAFSGVILSLTGKLAMILRDAVGSIARHSGIPVTIKQAPQPGKIVGFHDETVEILASDKAGSHGQSSMLALIDEGGLLGENKRGLWESILSSVSATPGGRCIAIGVRSTGPMFAESLDMAKRGVPGVVAVDHTAPLGCNLDDRSAWAAANPSLGVLKRLDYMEMKCAQAMETPAAQVHFRMLDLNQPLTEGLDLICDIQAWKRVEVEELPERKGPVYLGLDLGSTTSFTAATLFWPESGRLVGLVAVGNEPTLEKRGRADGCGDLYVEFHKAGELLTMGAEVVPMDLFMKRVYEEIGDSTVAGAGCDKHRRNDLLKQSPGHRRKHGRGPFAAQASCRFPMRPAISGPSKRR